MKKRDTLGRMKVYQNNHYRKEIYLMEKNITESPNLKEIEKMIKKQLQVTYSVVMKNISQKLY